MRRILNKLPAVIICILILLACTSHEYSVPDLQLYDVDSNLVSLHELLDTGPVFICVWALWGHVSYSELDALKPYYDELKSCDIHMLAVHLGSASTSEVDSLVNIHDWEYMVLLDPEYEINALYEISAIPTTLAIDQKGDLVFTYLGYKSGDEVMIVDTLRCLFGN
jgi:cytochrome c biogenesis protein CcmG/thiol:disulfide interchange protein DsbE